MSIVNVFCFKSDACVNFYCVTSPIAEIVLDVIPLISVIISIFLLLPTVNLSCFSYNLVSILKTDEDKLLIPLILESILPSKLVNLDPTSTPFTVIREAVIEPLYISTPSIYGGFSVILLQIIPLEIISVWAVILFCLLEFNELISLSLSSILPFAMPIEVESPTIEAVLIPTRSTSPGVWKEKPQIHTLYCSN